MGRRHTERWQSESLRGVCALSFHRRRLRGGGKGRVPFSAFHDPADCRVNLRTLRPFCGQGYLTLESLEAFNEDW